MSDSRRSGRSKKSIDYASFGRDGDSDEDFADPTPPPPKRAKKDKAKPSKKLEKKPREKSRNDASSSKMSKRKERPPLNDKLFDRDLELALELSKQESSSQESDADQVQYMGNRQKEIAVMVHTTGQEPEEKMENQPQLDPLRSETDNSHNEDGNKENMDDKAIHIISKTKENSPSNTKTKDDTITLIETLEGSDVERGRRQRKAASAAVAKQREMISDEDNGGGDEDGDDEFKADASENDFGASSSDDDYDAGDADSDFEGSKVSTKKKKGKSPKSADTEKKTPRARGRNKAATSSKAEPKGNSNSAGTNSTGPKASLQSPVTPIARRPQPKGAVKGFTPPTMSKSSGDKKQTSVSCSQSVVRRPSWCSPTSSNANNPLGGVKLVSPSQPLRLGLSRYARVKPLHANVKVP